MMERKRPSYLGPLVCGKPPLLNCGRCSARVEGKPWALLMSGHTHNCGGTVATSIVLSWHSSREASIRAMRVRMKKRAGRMYVMDRQEFVASDVLRRRYSALERMGPE